MSVITVGQAIERWLEVVVLEDTTPERPTTSSASTCYGRSAPCPGPLDFWYLNGAVYVLSRQVTLRSPHMPCPSAI